jgi:hypothetical protein
LDIVNEIKAKATLQRDRPTDTASNETSDCHFYVHVNFRTQADWSGCSRHVFPIHLAIASSCMVVLGQGCGEPDLRTQSFLLDPLATLLASRSARGALALERSKIEMCGVDGGECLNPDASIGFFRSHIRPDEIGLALGWYTSSELAAKIATSAIPSHAFNYRAEGNDNDNDISMLIYHFDLSLYDPSSPLKKIDKLLGSP